VLEKKGVLGALHQLDNLHISPKDQREPISYAY
jgi:hypothetical protein